MRRGWGLCAAVFLFCAGLMAMFFSGGQRQYSAMTSLPRSAIVTGLGHPVREGQININTADEETLDKLPGIGPVKAAAIVAWREEHGPFRCPEELIRVKGIGEKTLEGLLEQITVGGT